MRKKYILIFLFIIITSKIFSQIWPASLVGHWTFDNPSDLLHANVGSDLVLTGTHTAVSGTTVGDGAVAIDVGSYYTCTHGIPANGGGTLVNEYTVMFDVMVDNPSEYHCLYQTNQANSNDGDVFINPFDQIGISGTGYTGFSLKANEWFRLVVTVDLGNSLQYYIDGKLVLDGVSQAVDGRYSLDPTVLFFADDNGEDNLIYVTQVALFSSFLTSAEIHDLGGLHYSNINPYLQTPTTNSIYINWNSYDNASTIVQYGTMPSFGSSTSGSYEDIGIFPTINRWHTVKLTNLLPDTRYYYRCISGTDTSEIFHFHTPPNPGTTGKHIRFLKFGDSQTYVLKSTSIVDSAVFLLQQLYGNDWQDSISLVMSSGDICESGADLGRYMNEYFNPFSILSAYIPCMVSIGNHESENNYFYQFMKYEDLTGFNERYYTFNLGNCQYIAMNTNGLYNFSSQTSWLQTQLNTSANDPNIDFVFTYNHQPAHSEIWPDGNTSYVLNDLYPIEASYPKMVMTTHGHSHCYERGTIKTTHSGNWDFRTVICGGAGGELDRWGMYNNQTDYPEIQKSIDNYSFMLVDVDMSAKTVNTTMYSLGNPDKPRNLEVMDKWHRFLNQAAPDKPDAILPSGVDSATPTLTASTFSGLDSLMSSEFQLIPISGNFDSPLIDVIRDAEDYYWDSGTPDYIPLNLNNGIDLKTYTVDSGILSAGQSYLWRMRYRDQNVCWSDWSDTLQFLVTTIGISEQNDDYGIYIFPNPFIYKFEIKIPYTAKEQYDVMILDITGKTVFETQFKTNENATTSINTDDLEAGLYIVVIRGKDKTVRKKLIREKVNQ
ncbi:MAG: T9SS type A sorting domain-containing protein [Bacteroidota bacterium]